MNSAHVFKRQSFIAKNECVRIPEGDVKHDAINSGETAENDKFALKSENCLRETTAEEKMFLGLTQNERQEIQKALLNETDESNRVSDSQKLSETYKRELEELSEAVAERAYHDALNKKKGELRDCISSVQNLMDDLMRKHNEFVEQYTNELKYMAIDIAEKIMFEKISEDDASLRRLVLLSVNSVKSYEWLSVELSERLVGLVDFMKKELEKPEYKGKAHVFSIAGTDDICRVTTNEGTIVSTIGVQTENLRRAFREADQDSFAKKKDV